LWPWTSSCDGLRYLCPQHMEHKPPPQQYTAHRHKKRNPTRVIYFSSNSYMMQEYTKIMS
jgi:hypothetical protein